MHQKEDIQNQNESASRDKKRMQSKSFLHTISFCFPKFPCKFLNASALHIHTNQKKLICT
jgi:hypothetical protein